ncbi:serine/threonine-protein kinase PAK1 [Boeremia exigua]|uniref:serine/threonine-protein kinase PAK1 n=1 Tax=Boeremia exigua TaxID=749465 RepID=UPI001E8E0AF3|nr:serine/threonine-protein kinase PAK1 [Boeremia exigua]KAH6639343.1 serine/threonine-protein kinase PAK1 [Boeremia exigua]
MTGPAPTAGEHLDAPARSHSTPRGCDGDGDGDATPGQQRPPLDPADCTPRHEAPSYAVAAEPSYFSPQPRRTYSSTITRSTPASTDPSPAASANASTTSVNTTANPSATPPAFGPALHPLNRPAYERDLSRISDISTASTATVRAHPAGPLHHHFASEPSVAQHRDGPVYPNQSYAALQFQQYPTPYTPPILRARSSHPAHFSANSVSAIPSFGASNVHYRDIMESAPRTAGNSPVSSPGLFDPNRRIPSGSTEPTDGLYSSPWLHHTHRQAPKESHIADVTHDPVSGRKVVNQYEIIDELGRGVHGKVKLGKDLASGKYVAIKIVDRYSKRRRLGKNTSHEDKIKREIAILKKARHPNIVSLLEVIDDPAKKKVYIVLEHVELGEVKWRTEGAPEVTLVEWRRFQREAGGIFDDDRAAQEDERIIRIAHQKLARQRRREAREAHLRRQTVTGNEPWSFEFGGDSDDDVSSEAGRSSRTSNREDRPHSRVQFHERQEPLSHTDDTMETAFRASMHTLGHDKDEEQAATGLEGTMYGAYDTEFIRGRTPSVAESSSSHPEGEHEGIPEHFRYVPLMTIQGAWDAFKDTVLGLEYLHYQNVIHRDIKPANLLVTKEHRIKISDFGVSYLGRQKTDEVLGDQSENEVQEEDEAIELAKTVGTPAFYAPELCRTDFTAETPHIDGGIDVWALGITLYCLVYGRVPFHENNPFALMKAISGDEPYIPRYRLKPVSERATSRPNSHGRNMQPISNARRAPHDVDYEEIDDNLRDLLKRLLVKESEHRITIHEIKRHPWLLQGINNYTSWMEETDPNRSSQGRKIEITNDDLERAVVPVGFVERVRSAAKKATDYVTKSFTRGGSNSRRRAQSSAHDLPPSMSTTSSSSTISQDARRGSIAPNAILDMLGRSRECEHPLSHSVTASPEAKERAKYFDSPDSRKSSPMQNVETYRPALQDRSISSVYTIRQANLEPRATSPMVPSALPGTPTALDTPTGSHLGGLFGGLPRRVVNSMKSKDKLKPPRDYARKKSFDNSIDRLMIGEQDPHGVPSLALSTTNASGHVDQPDVKELSPIARSRSPSYSDAQSLDPLDYSSRQSSLSSLSSRLAGRWALANELEVGPTLDIPHGSWKSQNSSRSAHTANSHWLSSAHETSDERFNRAKDEFIRRRVQEQKMGRERSASTTQRPGSALDQTACPPSPDDVIFNERQKVVSQHQKVEEYLGTHHAESSENSPIGGQERGLAFCSSEEQFTPMSQSTSNPSIPSVASAGSSVPDECGSLDQFANMLPTASADSIAHNQFDAPLDDLAGYDGDHAIDSDEEDSSDDDGGLFMGRKKPAPKPRRSNSVSNGELARSNISKDIRSSRRRSARSGSNGTVKKIPPPGAADASATASAEQTPEA